MKIGLTLGPRRLFRLLSLFAGLGMILFSLLTIRHFFQANYPSSIYEGLFCDINTFFNCDSSAYSLISQIAGVPLGYFGMFIGLLAVLGATFPSPDFERTNRTISLVNLAGVVFLFLFSVLYLGSLCLLCLGYYFFAALSSFLFWRYAIDQDGATWLKRFWSFSPKHAIVFALLLMAGAYGFALYHDARVGSLTGRDASMIVQQFYNLPEVASPSLISPYMTVQSTLRFQDAPIRIVEFADFLCPDCLYLEQQLEELKREFAGSINIAFQFFPLETECNQVVDKDKHPGACELSFIAAHDPNQFVAIHDEVFANFEAAKQAQWRQQLAQRYGVEAAITDPGTRETVQRIIETGREYSSTSDQYEAGIRSTPTMIINNRMIIGTFPYEHLRAIFQALVDEAAKGDQFMENWVDEG